MGIAEFDVRIKLKGNAQELSAMLGVIALYNEGTKGVRFELDEIRKGNVSERFYSLNADKIRAFAESADGEIEVRGLGPYGHYGYLNDVDIFRDMAEAAPHAEFKAEISGHTTYTWQRMNCELKDEDLHIYAEFEENNECPAAYHEYFIERLPYEKFIELFQLDEEELDEEEFDEDAYDEFISDFFATTERSVSDMEYDDLVDWLNVDTILDEQDFDAVLDKIREMEIDSYEDFQESFDGGSVTDLHYDPIAKAYVGNDEPVYKSGEAVDVTEQMRAYLKANSLPSDDAAIAALSVEDAYMRSWQAPMEKAK